MRLHLDNNSLLTGAGQAGAAAGAQQASGSQGKPALHSGARSGDSVALSGPSAALGRLAADRAARVQQLSAAVKSGSYQISSSAISSALVGHSLL